MHKTLKFILTLGLILLLASLVMQFVALLVPDTRSWILLKIFVGEFSSTAILSGGLFIFWGAFYWLGTKFRVDISDHRDDIRTSKYILAGGVIAFLALIILTLLGSWMFDKSDWLLVCLLATILAVVLTLTGLASFIAGRRNASGTVSRQNL